MIITVRKIIKNWTLNEFYEQVFEEKVGTLL